MNPATSSRVRAVLLALLLAPAVATGADILGAFYDPARDALVVDIAYRGTKPNHAFSLEWGECRGEASAPYRTVARLIDRQGQDLAEKSFEVRARFPLASLECRPAEVTLRLGRVSHATVFVPAALR